MALRAFREGKLCFVSFSMRASRPEALHRAPDRVPPHESQDSVSLPNYKYILPLWRGASRGLFEVIVSFEAVITLAKSFR